MSKKAGSKDANIGKKIKKVDVDAEKGSFFFVALIGLLVVGAAGAVLYLAQARESNIDVAPLAGGEGVGDHWHWAYSINHCGTILSPAAEPPESAGIHTHGDGLVHIHPFRPDVSGANAKLGVFFEASGAELTDESYTPGPTEEKVTLSEEEGCDGKPATLKLAIWEDATDLDAEPTIIDEGLADFVFDSDGGMITLALVAAGEEIPPPPADRVQRLAGASNLPTGELPVTPGDDPGTEDTTVDGADTTVDGADTTVDGADTTVDGADTTADGSDTTTQDEEDPDDTGPSETSPG